MDARVISNAGKQESRGFDRPARARRISDFTARTPAMWLAFVASRTFVEKREQIVRVEAQAVVPSGTNMILGNTAAGSGLVQPYEPGGQSVAVRNMHLPSVSPFGGALAEPVRAEEAHRCG